MGEERKVC